MIQKGITASRTLLACAFAKIFSHIFRYARKFSLRLGTKSPRQIVHIIVSQALTFEQAITAFDDPYRLIDDDPKHSTQHEKREWLIGKSDTKGILLVVFTLRMPGNIYRLISARHANRREREFYEQNRRI